MAPKKTPLQLTAAEALGHFELHLTRPATYRRKPDSPEWTLELVYAVHNQWRILPDDRIYNLIVDALGQLAAGTDPDEFAFTPDVYTADLLHWVGSGAGRLERVDAMIREAGPGLTLTQYIMQAQYDEAREVFQSVTDWLTEFIERTACEECGEYRAVHVRTAPNGTDWILCSYCFDEM